MSRNWKKIGKDNLPSYKCMKCAARLASPPPESFTSYPIEVVLECPKCKTKHFLLADKVLCTEEDYNSRIHQYYKLEMEA